MDQTEKVKSRWTRSFFTAFNNMNDGERFVCDICHKDLANPANLALHRNTHVIERRYKCEPCQVSFHSQGHLQKHMRSSAHEACVEMTQAFGIPSSDNPRPYKCPECDIAFRKHGHLAKHLRSKSHITKLESNGLVPPKTWALLEKYGTDIRDKLVTTNCEQSLISLHNLLASLAQQQPLPRDQGTPPSASMSRSSPSASVSSTGSANIVGNGGCGGVSSSGKGGCASTAGMAPQLQPIMNLTDGCDNFGGVIDTSASSLAAAAAATICAPNGQQIKSPLLNDPHSTMSCASSTNNSTAPFNRNSDVQPIYQHPLAPAPFHPIYHHLHSHPEVPQSHFAAAAAAVAAATVAQPPMAHMTTEPGGSCGTVSGENVSGNEVNHCSFLPGLAHLTPIDTRVGGSFVNMGNNQQLHQQHAQIQLQSQHGQHIAVNEHSQLQQPQQQSQQHQQHIQYQHQPNHQYQQLSLHHHRNQPFH